MDFINADYTWLNGALAKAYHLSELTSDGKPGAEVQASGTRELKTTKHDGDRWTRVTLADRTRGGYLTMGAPLTVTSLPFRTSPVKQERLASRNHLSPTAHGTKGGLFGQQ
ncbi:MAG: hypothetical protein R3F31_11345 [Verrucomicrobiales bacterium]